MSILIGKETRVVTQGMTGKFGSFHTKACLAYGTRMVAGVGPGKGGQFFEGIPLFDTMHFAVKETGAEVSVIYVPPPNAAEAIIEAADSGIKLIVCITEGIPLLDMLRVDRFLRDRDCRLIGPNCPGIITPGECKIGIMPGFIHLPGRVGVVSRSGTLTYEAVFQLTALGIGQSTCIGIGGDPINGMSFVDCLKLFNEDPGTDSVVIIGEIGGDSEIQAARWIKQNMRKPVVGFIAGSTAPKGRRMGHAGAIISSGQETAAAKYAVFKEAGIVTVSNPAQIGETLRCLLNGQ